MQAANRIFPNAQLFGCLFHFNTEYEASFNTDRAGRNAEVQQRLGVCAALPYGDSVGICTIATDG